MAHQYPPMQPHQQQQQRPYSPYPPTANSPVQMQSPGGIGMPPAAKRTKLSPNPGSPYPYSHNSPYASIPGTPAQTHTPIPTFNQPEYPSQSHDATPRGPPPPGSMGPPQRPVEKTEKQEKEKATDLNDLSDSIASAGIDLREEENYLAQTWQNQHHQAQSQSFSAQFTPSPSTISPSNSFNALGGSFGGHPAFQGAGPVSQPPVSEKTVEDEMHEKHKAAARALAESAQQELNDPFLKANSIRNRIGKIAFSAGVNFSVEGLYDRIEKKSKNLEGMHGITAIGPDGTGIVRAEADALLDTSAPLVDILTLLSLATKDRLRTVLEDSYALARSRQLNSDGVVPPEYADIATGTGPERPATAVSASATNTAWDQPDSAVSPMTVPKKRALDSDGPKNELSRLPTPPTDTPPTPQPTISFASEVSPSLRKLSAEDRKIEKERLARRQKRVSSKDGSGTPGTLADPSKPNPSDIYNQPKMTKKERERIAKAGQTEEVLHRAANTTANMAIGGMKKYSWLSGGSGSGASTPRLNTNLAGPGSTSAGAGGQQDRNLAARDRKWGDWREDGPKGKSIQIRDFIAAMELDGNEKKTLARALVRLKADN
ncbi:transcription initiation factor TFIID component TAF4 family-domain-containing protein [Phyllosticta citriasiana]|uniref:Transcription initiation factor TFIID subunit 4 n=1 Tax=Phyllosticta citriasiana TaxID=595635 RepID=A0ABR1KMB4_9PEZI